MISIIICSRKPDISFELKSNIAVTIGIAYELIVIDNSNNKYSIFSAYNEGVRRAKFPYLCFMHEDILFHSKNWGEQVVKYFQSDDKIGLLGVVGTHFLPKTPSYWCDTNYVSGGLIQGWTENNHYNRLRVKHDKYIESKDYIEAAAIDGLWFITHKKLFKHIAFDDKSYTGFHFYEMDICMQVKQAGYKLIIGTEILIEHFSYGKGDKSFDRSRKIFYNKWKNSLPVLAGIEMSNTEIEIVTKHVYKSKLRQTKQYRLLKRIIKFIKNDR